MNIIFNSLIHTLAELWTCIQWKSIITSLDRDPSESESISTYDRWSNTLESLGWNKNQYENDKLEENASLPKQHWAVEIELENSCLTLRNEAIDGLNTSTWLLCWRTILPINPTNIPSDFFSFLDSYYYS